MARNATATMTSPIAIARNIRLGRPALDNWRSNHPTLAAAVVMHSDQSPSRHSGPIGPVRISTKAPIAAARPTNNGRLSGCTGVVD